MPVRLLDHDQAEQALMAARAYADYVRELERAVTRQRELIRENWQSASSEQFIQDLDKVLHLLNTAANFIDNAVRELARGIGQARHDEREAELRMCLGQQP
jgi:hypothetical protein